IRVEGLSKSYPVGFWRKRTRVLSDLSFSVAPNEIVGFLGPNGAGKTTTIKILNGLAFPDGGRAFLFGEEVGATHALRRRIGFMPEQPYFYEYLTGSEFLALCGRLNGMSRPEIDRRSEAMLSEVGLQGAGDKAIRKYSKGMMQRLGLAQALLQDPDLVILDEPMSGLDPLGRMEIRNLIRGLKEAGKTVFFSSHIISDVEALCDRVIMLRKGVKVAEDSVVDLMGTEIQYVELVFSPPVDSGRLPALGIPGEAASVQGNALVLRAADIDQANRWAEGLRGIGGRLCSMVPVKRRLEDFYVEQVVAGRGEKGGNP
ncbi:MAG TPA: ABC transporter ATP-binding protein, partial [Candidatus Deferrimicrobiaceae bacterium]